MFYPLTTLERKRVSNGTNMDLHCSKAGSFIKSSKSMIFRLKDFKTAAFWRIVVYFLLQLSYAEGKNAPIGENGF